MCEELVWDVSVISENHHHSIKALCQDILNQLHFLIQIRLILEYLRLCVFVQRKSLNNLVLEVPLALDRHAKYYTLLCPVFTAAYHPSGGILPVGHAIEPLV